MAHKRTLHNSLRPPEFFGSAMGGLFGLPVANAAHRHVFGVWQNELAHFHFRAPCVKFADKRLGDFAGQRLDEAPRPRGGHAENPPGSRVIIHGAADIVRESRKLCQWRENGIDPEPLRVPSLLIGDADTCLHLESLDDDEVHENCSRSRLLFAFQVAGYPRKRTSRTVF